MPSVPHMPTMTCLPPGCWPSQDVRLYTVPSTTLQQSAAVACAFTSSIVKAADAVGGGASVTPPAQTAWAPLCPTMTVIVVAASARTTARAPVTVASADRLEVRAARLRGTSRSRGSWSIHASISAM